MVDGVVESHTAAMLAPIRPIEPDVERHTDARQAQELNRAVKLLDGRGWQVMIHAIGGSPAFRIGARRVGGRGGGKPAVRRGTPPSSRTHRDDRSGRHTRLWKARRHRCSRSHVQSGSRSDRGVGGRSRPRTGQRDVAVSRHTRRGSHVFGSDWPVASMDAGRGITCGQADDAQGTPGGRLVSRPKLPLARRSTAIRAAGAWASFEDQRKGTLAPDVAGPRHPLQRHFRARRQAPRLARRGHHLRRAHRLRSTNVAGKTE